MVKKVRTLTDRRRLMRVSGRYGSLLLFICVMAVAVCGCLSDGADNFGAPLSEETTGDRAQTEQSRGTSGMTRLQGLPASAILQISGSEAASQNETRPDGGQKTSDDERSPEAAEKIYVYVCGCVRHPGVYGLDPGSRQIAAVEAAGGMLPEAWADGMNLAAVVTDGARIYVPAIEEAAGGLAQTTQDVSSPGLVNINTATKEELMTLSGIGASKAQRIIEYRESQGSFQNIEALKNVPGIKEGTYEALKDRITVG